MYDIRAQESRAMLIFSISFQLYKMSLKRSAHNKGCALDSHQLKRERNNANFFEVEK